MRVIWGRSQRGGVVTSHPLPNPSPPRPYKRAEGGVGEMGGKHKDAISSPQPKPPKPGVEEQDGSFGDTQEQIIRGYRGEAVVTREIQGGNTARDTDNTVPDNIQGKTNNDYSAPSVGEKEKVQQALTDCKFLKGRCETHNSTVGSENISSKVWAWLDKHKKYGWKYKKTKMK